MTVRLIALHGFTGSSDSFEVLRRVLKLPRAMLYCPNLVGHRTAPDDSTGVTSHRTKSTWERGGHCFSRQVDALAHQIDQAGMSGAHLLGYSLGGRMALGLLARHPQLFASATLVSTNPGLRSCAARVERSIADERWCRLLSHSLQEFIKHWSCQPLFRTQRRATPESLILQKRVREAQTAAGLSLSLRSAGLGQMPDLWSVADSFRRPLTVVSGARDEKFVRLGQAFVHRARARGGSRRTRSVDLANCGHNLVVEAPERLADVLRPSL